MPWILEDPGYWIKTEKIDEQVQPIFLKEKS